MVYLRADGTVVEKRSMWRLSIVPDFLWGVVDFFWLFVSTLINPQSEHNSLRPKRSSGGATGRGGGGAGFREFMSAASDSAAAASSVLGVGRGGGAPPGCLMSLFAGRGT